MTSSGQSGEARFVGSTSHAVAMLETVACEIAGTNIPILLLGEVGTGKEALARRIHEWSRREGRFLRVACSSITEEQLLDGLATNRQGDGSEEAVGTVLFDEISELDMSCQRDLLEALPEGKADLAGCIAGRVISTSSRNVDEEVRSGRFKSELYYRLNPVCLRLPPLRERRNDIPALSKHFLALHAAELGKALPALSSTSLEAFMSYSWPGNLRELENVAKKIVALNDQSFVLPELLGPRGLTHPGKESGSATCSLKAVARAASREAERDLILKALARTRWNRKRAAQELQVS